MDPKRENNPIFPFFQFKVFGILIDPLICQASKANVHWHMPLLIEIDALLQRCVLKEASTNLFM